MISEWMTLIIGADAASQPDDGFNVQRQGAEIVRVLGPTFTETSWLGWLTLFGFIVGGLIISRVTKTALQTITERSEARGWRARATLARSLAGPAALAIMTGAIGLGLQALWQEGALRLIVGRTVALLYISSVAWALLNLVDLIDVGMQRFVRHDGRLDDTVMSLLRKGLRLFLLIVMALFVVQNVFKQDITSWLAGLGIAGLAVSLAAQDSIKNIFGSLTVLMDRPFSLGDRIVFSGIDGVVEVIGFRSTKIRTMQGNLVTVPNMRFTDGTIENISKRAFFHRKIDIGITYDTPPDKLREAIDIVNGILRQPDVAEPIDFETNPPRVHFNEFKADNLNIEVLYWYLLTPERNFWTFKDHAAHVNLRILEALTAAGIDFAFPTQTMVLADDPKRRFTGPQGPFSPPRPGTQTGPEGMPAPLK